MTAPWRTPVKYHDARDTPLDPSLQLRWHGESTFAVFRGDEHLGGIVMVWRKYGRNWRRSWMTTTDTERRFATGALAANSLLPVMASGSDEAPS